MAIAVAAASRADTIHEAAASTHDTILEAAAYMAGSIQLSYTFDILERHRRGRCLRSVPSPREGSCLAPADSGGRVLRTSYAPSTEGVGPPRSSSEMAWLASELKKITAAVVGSESVIKSRQKLLKTYLNDVDGWRDRLCDWTFGENTTPYEPVQEGRPPPTNPGGLGYEGRCRGRVRQVRPDGRCGCQPYEDLVRRPKSASAKRLLQTLTPPCRSPLPRFMTPVMG
ncbi:hypothetical protein Hte_003264 [Hypoxylon texense]